MRRLSRSHEERNVVEVYDWFQFHVILLDENRDGALATMSAGMPLASPLAGLAPSEVADFFHEHRKAVMALRNWLAHGRFWNPKLGREFGVGDVFDVCRMVLKELNLIEN